VSPYGKFSVGDDHKMAIFSFYRTSVNQGTRRCFKDYNCGKNMECLEGICYCKNGFFPENDYCIGFVS
jgi:hypothetical protein